MRATCHASHAGHMSEPTSRRPVSLTILAVALALAAAATTLAGIGLTFVSNCCGSSEPQDPTPFLVCSAAAVALGLAARWTWWGRGSLWVIIATGAVLALAFAVSPTSSDLQALLVLLTPGWLLLVLLLRRDAATAWFEGTSGRERVDQRQE